MNNDIMPTLKERIEAILKGTRFPNVDMLIAKMNEPRSFYSCTSGSHDCWKGGTMEHSWRVFQYMVFLKKHPEFIKSTKVNNIDAVSEIQDECLALVGLLHDLGKGYHDVRGGHEERSTKILEKYIPNDRLSDYEQVLGAIYFHHNRRKHHIVYDKYKDCLLRILLNQAENMASGTTWNAELFKRGLSQRNMISSSSNYLHRDAMDRTNQILNYHVYLDYNFECHKVSCVNRDKVMLDVFPEVVKNIEAFRKEYCILEAENKTDIITPTHEHSSTDRLCLVIGCDKNAVADERHLCQTNKVERELLICSNILRSFFRVKDRCKKHDSKSEFKYLYTTSDCSASWLQCSSIYIEGVKIIRDGSKESFRLVAPWDVNVLLIPGGKFSPFAVKSENLQYSS